jgi:hypothetical protein
MKRLLLLGALAVAALVPVGAAGAATNATHTLRGTIVAKDSSHRALVVALAHGKVQTVVARAAFRRSAVGRTVSIRYTLVPGSFPVARTVKLRSVAHHALVKGTIVRLLKHHAILNAGGSLLDVNLHSVKKQRSLAGFTPVPQVGDTVTVDVQIGDDDSLEASEIEVEDAPAAPQGAGASEGEMSVRGKVKGPLSPTQITVTTGTGVDVTCVIPSGVTLTAAVGDAIELECDLIGGTWTVRVAGQEDSGDHSTGGDHSGKVEVKGMISLLTDTQIQVTPTQGDPVTCAVPATVSAKLLAQFKLQDQVELQCTTIGGVPTLDEIDGRGDSAQGEEASSGDTGDGGSSGGQGGGGASGPSDD